MTKPAFSIVLPNYNGRKLLEDNLPSLYSALKKSGETYEVILADDNSTDDSLDFISNSYPDITIIRAIKNRGFSANCNLGFKHCNGRLTCLASTDITFDENYFINALKYFNDESVFAIKGPLNNYAEDRNKLINTEYYNRLYLKHGFVKILHLKDDFPYSNESDYILLGACFVADTEKLQQLGGFDEIYSPYYWEDSDLPLRAKQAGYSLIYAPDCQLWHRISSTISTTQSKRKRRLISIRNKFIFTWRFLAGPQQWIYHLFFLMFGLLTRWIVLDWKYYVCLLMASYRRLTWRSIH